jgi:ribonuclease BN (tRNA processing enzyme)
MFTGTFAGIMPYSAVIWVEAAGRPGEGPSRNLTSVRITIVGCSGSFAGADSAASCYLVEAEGFRMLMDLGGGALGAVQRYADLYEIDAVLLSHLHADHCLDVCGFSVARTFHPDGPKPRIPVYGPAQAEVRLGRAMAADPAGHDAGAESMDQVTNAFDFVTITPGTIEIGPLRVTAARMNHPVETHGFRLEHAGRSLAYSADTGETGALVTLARDADVLLCEASFTEPPAGSAVVLPTGLHLTARQAGQHAARAGAGQLVLTHLPPWRDKNQSLDEAGRAFDGPLSLAAPGLGFVLD